MTEWTEEEERVRAALASLSNGCVRIPCRTNDPECACWKRARSAISAMQPRWRDVKTDTPQFTKLTAGMSKVEKVTTMAMNDAITLGVGYIRAKPDGSFELLDPDWVVIRDPAPPLPPAPEDKP